MMESNAIHAEFNLSYPSAQGHAFSLDVNFSIPNTGVTAIFGPSGSGKTSLLRAMVGLDRIERARFQVGKEVWQDNDYFLAVHKRQLGYIFQEASLFSHLTVQGNLDYALTRANKRARRNLSEHQGASAKARVIDVNQLIPLLKLAPLLKQYPSSLSGGERQRVAIARSLLSQPKILFMDEPLAALDYKLKQDILPYLETISQAFGIPIVYVTHSLGEVARLADYLLVMDAGRIIARGTLSQVLSQVDLPIYPENEQSVVLTAQVIEKDVNWHLMKVSFDGGELWLKDSSADVGSHLRVRVLAKDVSLALHHHDSSILNCLPAIVVDIIADQDKAMVIAELKLGEVRIMAKLTKRSVAHLSLVSGKQVWAQIKSVAILS